MKTTLAQDRALLETAGIVLPSEFRAYTEDAAQPGALTQVNAGIPAFLANFIDPKFIEVLVTPMKIAKITGERGMGTWTTKTAQFPQLEYSGEVSTYGDYNQNGSNGVNANWLPRQQYIYQSICNWGDHEMAMMALGKIDYANGIRNAKALNFNKFQNKSYAFGIAGLQNFGLLNDPLLPPSIAPVTKTGGGTVWSAASLAIEVYADIQNLVQDMITRTGGLVDLETEMILAMSPASSVAMTKITAFGTVSVEDMLKKAFPNMRIETAPEYTTASGNLVQLIIPTLEGQETLFSAFGDKMRAFPVFRALSSFEQKFASGTWGCIIKLPIGISSLLGV